MKKTFVKPVLSLLFAAIFAICLLPTLSSCSKDEKPPQVDYSAINDYEVETSETDDEFVFSPKGASPSYGLIFYVGTALHPTGYAYLGEALARQGYLVVMPKMAFYLAWLYYKTIESAFDSYPNVNFFVGGHSQGGGAAVRRAQEEESRIKGVVLYAPYCYLYHNVYDENDDRVVDENGDYITVDETLQKTLLPVLLLEAEQDRVLGAVKSNVDKILNDNVERHVLSPASHMSFSTFDDDATLKLFNGDGDGITQDQKDAQRALVVSYTVDFMRSLCA